MTASERTMMDEWSRPNQEANDTADKVANAAKVGDWDRARILGKERESTLREGRIILAAVTESVEKRAAGVTC